MLHAVISGIYTAGLLLLMVACCTFTWELAKERNMPAYSYWPLLASIAIYICLFIVVIVEVVLCR